MHGGNMKIINNTDELSDYMYESGLNTINIGSPAWKLLSNLERMGWHFPMIDKTICSKQKNIIDKTIEHESGQKMSVGILVRHRTVPLGLGLVVAESGKHKGFWIVKWCDPRYHDVGMLGIQSEYLEIV